jgi:hypothetical protein
MGRLVATVEPRQNASGVGRLRAPEPRVPLRLATAGAGAVHDANVAVAVSTW